jgi:hypothetical protein
MELDLSDFQKEITKLVQETHVPSKHCARSSIFHIQKAWQIRTIDPEMAVFRAITGDEEASTAIFYSLKRLGYKGSNFLNPYDHFQKSAVTPFLKAVGYALDSFSKVTNFDPKIEIRKEEDKIRVRLRLTITDPERQKKYAYPEPPLNWKFEIDGKLPDFKEQIEKIASEKNAKSIIKHIKDLANKRNMVLYASSCGVPRVQGSIDNYLNIKRDEIFTKLTVFLMFDPYKEKQLFVEQVLKAFLQTLELIPKNLISEFS